MATQKELGQILSELKHTISSSPAPNPHHRHPATRRLKSHVESKADVRDRMNVVLVVRGKKLRMQVPVTSMTRLQDFFEDKYEQSSLSLSLSPNAIRLKIMKSLQRVVYKDQELLPSDSKPFLTHSISEGDEIHIREDPVSLTLRLPHERSITFREVYLTDPVSRIKWRYIMQEVGSYMFKGGRTNWDSVLPAAPQVS